MKKLFCILIMCLVTGSMSAQKRVSYSLEYLSLGVGFGKGPAIVVSPDFVAQYDWGNGLKFGAGAGLRFAMPCGEYDSNATNGARRISFDKELDLPLFMRISYGPGRFSAGLDAGYAIGLYALWAKGSVPGGKKDPSFNGLFFEPQLTWMFNEEEALSLGLLMQQCSLLTKVAGASSYEKVFVPAITIRYGMHF